MKRLVVNFSGRLNGNCEKVSNIIKENFVDDEVEIISFNHLNVNSCTNCKYECFENNEKCPYYNDDIRMIYNKIMNNDFIYYVIPNYCGYPCASFFTFNERRVSIFGMNRTQTEEYLNKSKKFIVISASNEDNFKEILRHHTIMVPDILFLNARAYNQKPLDGTLLKNEKAKKKLIKFLSYMYA